MPGKAIWVEAPCQCLSRRRLPWEFGPGIRISCLLHLPLFLYIATINPRAMLYDVGQRSIDRIQDSNSRLFMRCPYTPWDLSWRDNTFSSKTDWMKPRTLLIFHETKRQTNKAVQQSRKIPKLPHSMVESKQTKTPPSWKLKMGENAKGHLLEIFIQNSKGVWMDVLPPQLNGKLEWGGGRKRLSLITPTWNYTKCVVLHVQRWCLRRCFSAAELVLVCHNLFGLTHVCIFVARNSFHMYSSKDFSFGPQV